MGCKESKEASLEGLKTAEAKEAKKAADAEKAADAIKAEEVEMEENSENAEVKEKKKKSKKRASGGERKAAKAMTEEKAEGKLKADDEAKAKTESKKKAAEQVGTTAKVGAKQAVEEEVSKDEAISIDEAAEAAMNAKEEKLVAEKKAGGGVPKEEETAEASLTSEVAEVTSEVAEVTSEVAEAAFGASEPADGVAQSAFLKSLLAMDEDEILSMGFLVGPSEENSKTVRAPGVVSVRSEPVNSQSAGWTDRFEATVSDDKQSFTVRRVDSETDGWGQELELIIEVPAHKAMSLFRQNNGDIGDNQFRSMTSHVCHVFHVQCKQQALH